MDGMVRIFDVTNPRKPKLVLEEKIGSQVNMVSQSWDGKRLYFTSSLLANWDKTGADDEQFLKAYDWDGKSLKPAFSGRLQGREARPRAPDELREHRLLPRTRGRLRLREPRGGG